MRTSQRTAALSALIAVTVVVTAACGNDVSEAPRLDGFRMETAQDAAVNGYKDGRPNDPMLVCQPINEELLEAIKDVEYGSEPAPAGWAADTRSQVCGYAQHAEAWLDDEYVEGEPIELALGMRRMGAEAVLNAHGVPENSDAQVYVGQVLDAQRN